MQIGEIASSPKIRVPQGSVISCLLLVGVGRENQSLAMDKHLTFNNDIYFVNFQEPHDLCNNIKFDYCLVILRYLDRRAVLNWYYTFIYNHQVYGLGSGAKVAQVEKNLLCFVCVVSLVKANYPLLQGTIKLQT